MENCFGKDAQARRREGLSLKGLGIKQQARVFLSMPFLDNVAAKAPFLSAESPTQC